MKSVINLNSAIYYKGKYWNDFQPVIEYISQNFTGYKDKTWVQDFKERFALKPFQHGLFLNCGNGWVEREFIDKNIVKKAAAFDYSTELLETAKNQKGKRSIRYFQADVNKIDFKENQFDLIVNVAALHHVQYINKLSYILAKSLKKNGIFVNFDYIGPQRNQYPLKQWFYVHKVNNSLPNSIKKDPLNYPHLPTMLHHDPTEAIHSDLIIESLSRYFDIVERHDTAGGIAYIILTHNPKLDKVPAKTLDIYLNKILDIDRKYTLDKKVPPMFSYFIAKPNKEKLQDKKRYTYFQKIENRREKKAAQLTGIYSTYDIIKLAYHFLKLLIIRDNHTRLISIKQCFVFIYKRIHLLFLH